MATVFTALYNFYSHQFKEGHTRFNASQNRNYPEL